MKLAFAGSTGYEHVLCKDCGSYAPCEHWCYRCPKVSLGSNGPYIISERFLRLLNIRIHI